MSRKNLPLLVGAFLLTFATQVAAQQTDALKALDAACAKTETAKKLDAVAALPTVYTERYRPQFHFTTKKGWINDPCGLVFYEGEYHIFNDHNPFGLKIPGPTPGSTSRPPSRWSHAVSKDLVHWEELPIAILPSKLGGVFSGSGVVDKNNTAGLGKNAIVLAYTSAGGAFSQSLSYSNDRGRTWTFYEKNPVVPNQKLMQTERDPRVFWYEPGEHWVMVLYVKRDVMRIFTSPNLKEWTFASDFQQAGLHECPELFALPLDGDPNKKLWILYGASFNYLVGTFDGKTFTPQTEPIRGEYGNSFYASQTWSNAPGRRIQIAWMNRGRYPGMPFNQQQSFPCELKLVTTPEGPRLTRMPVPEIASLYQKNPTKLSNVTLIEGDNNPLAGVSGELFDIEITFQPGLQSTLELTFHEGNITWSKNTVTALGRTAPLPTRDGVVKLRILLDRASLEVFGNDGRVSLTSNLLPKNLTTELALNVEGDPVKLESVIVRKLNSAWK